MRRQRLAARRAAALMAEWHITPEGIDLVCWLAEPNTRSNAEALRSWIVLQDEDLRMNHPVGKRHRTR